ncbi:hypothetical protein RFI_17007 [Reticulomyxa filosa]|uniref:Uncharacterized protein n=1 Tax=Reticulomyxa filosa TaxID=46433 RepID=X6N1Q9_RETFI|nr:hypothetical protein RFI_17007 [Reticulomyxa filosa]|eukprot:ETO20210.1 hypothetical protein RFI_17007 [Reticulomyxa filosa]
MNIMIFHILVLISKLYHNCNNFAMIINKMILKSTLQNYPIGINNAFKIHYKHWDIARYCIEQEMIKMCKWILRKRIMYHPIEQIRYAIDDNGVPEDYKVLLQEGSFFYWAACRNMKLIKTENSKKNKFSFLINRIFLLFEICIKLKQEENNKKLTKDITFKQVYEKGITKLQVQLTTYWDYITTEIYAKHPILFWCSDKKSLHNIPREGDLQLMQRIGHIVPFKQMQIIVI